MNELFQPSKPFSNGTEYEVFLDNFCCRCTKYKTDKNNKTEWCPTAYALECARWDENKWPSEKLIRFAGYYHLCLGFQNGDADLMKRYNNLFTIKAITLWQPWASLLAIGAKIFETRPWSTRYRGPIAIHAARKPEDSTLEEMFPHTDHMTTQEIDFMSALRSSIKDFDAGELPHGAIIATAELVDCHKIVLYGGRGISSTDPGWIETPSGIYEPTRKEILFGDWSKGRYAWEFKNMRMLETPIPSSGKHGLWNYTCERSA